MNEFICLHICAYTYINIYIYVCVCTYMYVCVYVKKFDIYEREKN